MTIDYKTMIEDKLADISMDADDATYEIEVDDVDVQYANAEGGSSASISFDVDAHVPSIEGVDLSEWVLITKSDLAYAINQMAESIEENQSVKQDMIPLASIIEVLSDYTLLRKDNWSGMYKQEAVIDAVKRMEKVVSPDVPF